MLAHQPPLPITSEEGIKREDFLLEQWLLTARKASLIEIRQIAADQSGRQLPQSETSAQVVDGFVTTALSPRFGYTKEEVYEVMRHPTCNPLDRVAELERDYRENCNCNEDVWRKRNSLWAAPQEFALALEQLKASSRHQLQTPTVIQAQSAIAPFTPPPTPELRVVEPVITPIARPTVRLDSMAGRFQMVLERTFEVPFIHVGTSDNGRIHQELFVQDLAAKNKGGNPYKLILVSAIQSRLPSEILTHGGIEKGQMISVSPGVGSFSIQVSNPHWNREVDYISVEEIAPFEDKNLTYLQSNSDVRVPLGKNIEGEKLWWKLSTPGHGHMLIAGLPGGGKTGLLREVVYYLTRFWHPGFVQLALVDPQAVNLRPFCGLPWIWEASSRVRETTQQIDELLDALEKELDDRNAKFAKAGVNSLEEFNQYEPFSPVYRLFVAIEEFPRAREMATSTSRFDLVIGRVGREGERKGVHLILCTQDVHADRNGALNPQLKSYLGTIVCFQDSPQGSLGRMLFDEFDTKNLQGAGDGFFWDRSMNYPERFQAYHASLELMGKLQNQLQDNRPYRQQMFSRRPDLRLLPGFASAPETIATLPESSERKLKAIAPAPSPSPEPAIVKGGAIAPALRSDQQAMVKAVRNAIKEIAKENKGIVSQGQVFSSIYGKEAGSGRKFTELKPKFLRLMNLAGYEGEDLGFIFQSIANSVKSL